MNNEEIENAIIENFIEFFEDEIEFCNTFIGNGVLTGDNGVVAKFKDGSEFQITIVQSKLGDSSPSS